MNLPRTSSSESWERRSRDSESVAVGAWLHPEVVVAGAVQVKKHFFNCNGSKRRNSPRKKLNLNASWTSKTGSSSSDKPKKPDSRPRHSWETSIKTLVWAAWLSLHSTKATTSSARPPLSSPHPSTSKVLVSPTSSAVSISTAMRESQLWFRMKKTHQSTQ